MLAGEPGDAFYILVDGTVRIERDGRTVRSIGTGGFLGEIALVERRPRSATATAVTDVTALVLHQHEFDRLLETMPAVHRRVLAAIERRERGEKPETA